jgi:tetratricopeptide (TPR) repeat protein
VKARSEIILMMKGIGVKCIMNKKYDEAISYFSKAIEAQNSFSIKKLEGDIHTNLGLTYTFQGRF